MSKALKDSTLSKSQYLKGIQCPKALWLSLYRKDLIPEIDAETQALFDQGHEVGTLAQQLFAGGTEIKREYYDIDGFIADTNTLIASGATTLYEACALSPEGLYAKIDILHKVSADAWDLIEVKSTTDVKDTHIDDMASQRFAFERAGYKINKSYLMHLNNQYVRQGELNLNDLFVVSNQTAEVQARMQDVEKKLTDLLKIKSSATEPQAQIGARCDKPYACDFKHHCWNHVPQYSVYDLLSEKKQAELISMNILDVKNIPEDFKLTERQHTFVTAYKTNETIVNREGLQAWIDQLVYPLHYLDYETAMTAIPPFDGIRPFQQIPFQFSLHIQKEPNGICEHIEFLNTESKDPRLDFVERLIQACDTQGSIVVYNQSFERARNSELAEQFPKYALQLQALNDRIVDLMEPFQKRHLYNGAQMGSHSIKSVLPTFCPQYNYKELDISDGGTASRLGLQLLLGQCDPAEKKQIVEGLKKYCALDTYAMVELVGVVGKYL